MAHRKFNPATIAQPPSYMMGVESAPGLRWLHVAGQLGQRPDGTVSTDFTEQADQAFANLVEVLKGANMGVEDVVRMTTYILDRDNLGGFRVARDKWFGKELCASTLLIVAGLARAEYQIEVECIAAKA